MDDIKQVIIVRKDLNMRRGKECAQVAHASMKVFFDMLHKSDDVFDPYFTQDYYCDFTNEMLEWMEGSFKKIVLSCDSVEELLELQKQAEEAGVVNAIILDNGETEFKKMCEQCHGTGIYRMKNHYEFPDSPCEFCNGTGKINKPTYTALAIGPDYSSKIDPLTKHLKLR